MKKINVSKDKIFYTTLCLVSFGILIKIYKYLTELENCKCYNEIVAYRSLKINIDFLKAYQIFEMFLIFLLIVIIYFQKSKPRSNVVMSMKTFAACCTFIVT